MFWHAIQEKGIRERIDMAKTSSIARNEKRKALVRRYFDLSKEMKKKLLDAAAQGFKL